MVRGLRVGLEVRHVIADPAAGCGVPPDLPPGFVPRLAVPVARSAVVEDATVRRPRPRPVWIDAEARRILRPAARHLIAGFGPTAAVDPVAAQRTAVVPQERKSGQLLAGLNRLS